MGKQSLNLISLQNFVTIIPGSKKLPHPFKIPEIMVCGMLRRFSSWQNQNLGQNMLETGSCSPNPTYTINFTKNSSQEILNSKT